MPGRQLHPNQRSKSSLFDSRSTSDKSESRGVSRAPSKSRYDDDDDLEPQRTISFDSRFTSDDKKDDSPSRSPSSTKLPGQEIEAPRGPVRRDTVQSLTALSVHQSREEREEAAKEPKWPKDWRAYVCLLGGFLLMFNSWGIVNAYGTFASYYMQNLLPGTDILFFNLIGSTESFVVLLLSAPVGRFLDAGYIRTLIIIGTVLVTVGQFTLSVSSGGGEYDEGNFGLIWLTQGFVTGLGMACFFVSSSQVVATWFKAKKGLAIGIVASGASIAGVIYPYMFRSLVRDEGFNNATRYEATVICITCMMAIFIARPNPKHVIRKPEKWFRVSVFIDSHAFKNGAFCWMMASIAFLFFGFYAVFFNLEEWAVSEGFGYRAANSVGANSGIPHPMPEDSIHTYWLLAIMNGSSTIGRIGSAWLCDHFGALNVHCAVTFIASLLTLILWTLTSNLNSAIAFVVVFGAFSGAVIGLPPASMAYILGPDPHAQAKLGQWTGMMYSGAAVFALTGPVIAGHLITEYSTFITVQMWAGGCMFMSAMCMGAAIYCLRRQRAPATSSPGQQEKQGAQSV